MLDLMQKHVFGEIKAHKLTIGFTFTLDPSNSVACTDQSFAPKWPVPLVINIIEVAILYTTI